MKIAQILLLCLLLPACRSGGNRDKTVWRASADNGDKPGIGIELAKVDSIVTATYYIMSPADPEKFTSARICPTTFRWINETEIVLEVEFASDNRISLRVRLQRPLGTERVPATVQDASGRGRTFEMVFVQTKPDGIEQ